MAYPPPPGTSNLPARPPPSNDSSNGGSGGFTKGGFKPSFSASSASLPQQPYARTASAFLGANAIHGPAAPPQSQYGPSSYTSYSAPGTVNAPPSYSPSYQRQAAPSRQPQGYSSHAYSQPPSSTSYAAPPTGETTDDSLYKAFSRWGSLQKSRVVRDKRTNKSKGYGFVSFSDADDFFQAAKEMNGKYIQSHPVVVRKAKTEIKVTNAKDKDKGRHKNNRKNHNGGNGSGGGGGGSGGYEPNLGPHGGATKIGKKTKNGLRLLG
ncbi:unnamed protein product [Clonostachys rosea f. rosea IK726]|uniref:RRM domain-containing protein n=2 Tax=Bionectria ochroleuca TaxID=29856 RepID=A0A0B7JV30_BIOOC|nr:unnamed protein product [Clonostachys rosea f. rosea IK726]